MAQFHSLCVYCGASTGHSPIYAQAADQLAAELVQRRIALVYGGGNIGLMGRIADGVMRRGGTVTGVIPKGLMDREVGHHGLTTLHIVRDMHERKALMAELSDGFLAMPGGMGTLEELFEALTWAQLGFHAKPIGLLNTNGYYNGLLRFLAHQVNEGFLRADQAALLRDHAEPAALIDCLISAAPQRPADALPADTARRILP